MFDRATWRAHVGKRLDTFARNPQQDMYLSGSPSLLTHLTSCTLHPFLQEYERAPISAIQVLAAMADGPGANELVRRARHLRYQGARILDQELRHSAEFRADIERMLVAIDTIHLVRQRLHGTRADWFTSQLTSEITSFSPTAFPQLRRRLHDRWKSFYDIFRELRQRQGSYTPQDLILLYVGLNDSASSVRAEASRRLGEYAWVPPEKLVNKLIYVALYDHDLETRNAAARALGSLREHVASPHLLDSLVQHLNSNDRFVRSASALLLAELGELAGTEPLISKLVALLSDADHYAREAAACALGRIGGAAVRTDVMEALTYALEDTNEDVHGAALVSLTHLRELRTTMLRRPNKPTPGTNPLPSSGSHDTSSAHNGAATARGARQQSRKADHATPESGAALQRNAGGDVVATNGRRNEPPPSMLELGS
jgi:hypothetical protein